MYRLMDGLTTDVQMRTVHLGIVETYIFLKSHSYKLAMSYGTTFTLALSLARSSILTIFTYSIFKRTRSIQIRIQPRRRSLN